MIKLILSDHLCTGAMNPLLSCPTISLCLQNQGKPAALKWRRQENETGGPLLLKGNLFINNSEELIKQDKLIKTMFTFLFERFWRRKAGFCL